MKWEEFFLCTGHIGVRSVAIERPTNILMQGLEIIYKINLIKCIEQKLTIINKTMKLSVFASDNTFQPKLN